MDPIYLYKITTRKCGDPDEERFVISLKDNVTLKDLGTAVGLDIESMGLGSAFVVGYDHIYIDKISDKFNGVVAQMDRARDF